MPLGSKTYLHLNPSAGSRFTYCPCDQQFFDFNRPSNPLGFLGCDAHNELALGRDKEMDLTVKHFDVDFSSGHIKHKQIPGQVTVEPSESAQFLVCKGPGNQLTVITFLKIG
jgi:hypothetical protein